MNWNKAKKATETALRNCLALEHQGFLAAGDDDIKALAARMVSYWKAQQEGDVLNDNLLDTAIHRAHLLCQSIGVDARGKAKRVERLIQMFALVGTELIDAFEEKTPGAS